MLIWLLLHVMIKKNIHQDFLMQLTLSEHKTIHYRLLRAHILL